jgi:ribosomal protein S19E (S16A)
LDLSHARWVIVDSHLRGIYGTKKTLSAGTKEHRMAANELSRDQLLQQLENVPNLLFEKDEKKKKKRQCAKRVS